MSLLSIEDWRSTVVAEILAERLLLSKQVEALNAAYTTHVERTQPEEAGACLLRASNDGYQCSTVSQASVFFASTPESEVSWIPPQHAFSPIPT